MFILIPLGIVTGMTLIISVYGFYVVTGCVAAIEPAYNMLPECFNIKSPEKAQ